VIYEKSRIKTWRNFETVKHEFVRQHFSV